MKLISAVVVAASVGTCAVGGQQRIPPSPAEQASTQNPKPAPTQSDPWVGIPGECRALSTPCDDCDEVQRMRRKIEFKKCVTVCDAYLDRTEMLADVPQDAIAVLQGAAGCGKTETACSPVEQSRCEYMIGYTSVGALFRAHWAEQTVPPEGLAAQFGEEFLGPYLDHHQRVIDWARSNEVEPAALISMGGELLGITATDLITDVTSSLASASDPGLPALSGVVDLARYPGDPTTFADRRAAAEASPGR